MLSLREKCRLIDLMFQPNGYTVMAFKAGTLSRFPAAGRIRANAIVFNEL